MAWITPIECSASLFKDEARRRCTVLLLVVVALFAGNSRQQIISNFFPTLPGFLLLLYAFSYQLRSISNTFGTITAMRNVHKNKYVASIVPFGHKWPLIERLPLRIMLFGSIIAKSLCYLSFTFFVLKNCTQWIDYCACIVLMIRMLNCFLSLHYMHVH